MIDIFVFILTSIIVIRTLSYGFWVFSSKNIVGGLFVFLVCGITFALSIYLLILDRT